MNNSIAAIALTAALILASGAQAYSIPTNLPVLTFPTSGTVSQDSTSPAVTALPSVEK